MTDEEGYSADMETKMHQTIKKVSSDFENLKYNTAIAAMMALINDFYKKNAITRGEFKTLITLLNPVAIPAAISVLPTPVENAPSAP